jgi:addiction module HigA family antidote
MSKAEGLMAPVHPGKILREDFMKPLGLSVNKLALELHVPATRIGEIIHERRRTTAETAMRLQDERGVLAEPAEYLRSRSDAAVRQGCGD